MGIRFFYFVLFYASLIAAFGQPQYFLLPDAVQGFTRDALYEHELIQITWNMEGKIQADLNNGINDLADGRSALAIASFSSVIDQDSLLWQAYYYRAVAQNQLNKHEFAYRDLKVVIQLNPACYEGYVELAKTCLRLKLLTESYEAAKQAVQLDRLKAMPYYIQGEVFSSQYQPDKALNSYQTCLRIDTMFNTARIKLAIIELIDNKNQKAAINQLNRVLKINPTHRHALTFRSILVFDTNPQQTLQDFAILIQFNPNNLAAYYLRGLLYTNLQQYSSGFLDFQKVMKGSAISDNSFRGQRTWIDKKIDIQNIGAYALSRMYGLEDGVLNKIKEAYCHIIVGNPDRSIKLLNTIPASLRDPLLVYLKAVAYEHKGDHVNAFQLYNKAVELDNTIFDAYKKRGMYEQNMKQWDLSIQDFTTALQLIPDLLLLHKLRGISYYFNNENSKALDDLNIYLKFDSADVLALQYRGKAYSKNKQTLNSYIDLANSSALDTLNLRFMLQLVDSTLVAGDTAKAEVALASFVKAAPTFTEGYILKFKLNLAKKAWSEVEKEITKAVSNIRTDASRPDQAYLLTVQGMVFARQQLKTEALKKFNEALKLDSQNGLIYYERGKLLVTSNKTTKAIQDLKIAASLGSVAAAKELLRLKSQ
jgi:predicted negative regulator of RcsB-dependent stress response